MTSTSVWDRQRTTKLYVHPPRCERMITLWPDLKLVDSPVGLNVPVGAKAFGVALAFGDGTASVDWTDTEIRVRDDGFPMHTLRSTVASGLTAEIEVATSTGHQPDISLKITLYNANDHAIPDSVYIIPREGNETYLMGMGWDGYCSYAPQLAAWGMIPSDARPSHAGFTCADRVVSIHSSEAVLRRWLPAEPGRPLHLRNVQQLDILLQGHTKEEIFLVITRSRDNVPTHADLLQQSHDLWTTELAPAQPALRDLKIQSRRAIAQALLVQILQMVVRHQDTGRIAPRQGGIHRGVWPTEAIDMLRGLDDFGLHETSAEVYRFFADTQVASGEQHGMIVSSQAPQWGGNTGALLAGLARHLREREQPNPQLEACASSAFDWIVRTRRTAISDGSGQGLFPSLQSSDWAGESQHWTWTDGWNVLGCREYVDFLRQRGDARLASAERELRDYARTLEDVLEGYISGWREGEELSVPDVLGQPVVDPMPGPYTSTGPSFLLRAGTIPADSPLLEGLEAYSRNRGLWKNGLTGLMTDSLMLHGTPSDPWAGHMWYTTFSDLTWFNAFLNAGRKEDAREILEGQLLFGMTQECYVAERYADNDPSFAPWQPNASGSGRILSMLRAESLLLA